MKPVGSQLIAEFTHCSKKYLNNRKALEGIVREGIEKCGLGLISIKGHKFDPIGVTVIAVISESHIAIHTYPEALHASIDIFTCASGSKSVNRLMRFLKGKLRPKRVGLVELLRGNPIEIKEENWATSFSGPGCGFETRYHVKKNIYSKRSKFQQIDIIENDTFGKMMFLDKDVQIAEIDAQNYSWNMISPIIEKKRRLDKVAILGGGDGGILYEILKHDPKRVFLIDIDEDVIKVSRRHLRRICRGAFSDKRATIVVDDANKFLETHDGFDAIIYDLTMHPEALTNIPRIDFLNQIFAKVGKSLNKRGMVTMQCCSDFDKDTMKHLKKILPKHFKNIKFRKVFITSFCENWIFASAEMK
jgi:spermidine synthase